MASPVPSGSRKPQPSGKKMPPAGGGGSGARRAEMRVYYRQNKLAFQKAKETAYTTGDRSALKALRGSQRTFVQSKKPEGGWSGMTPPVLPPANGHDDGFDRNQWNTWRKMQGHSPNLPPVK